MNHIHVCKDLLFWRRNDLTYPEVSLYLHALPAYVLSGTDDLIAMDSPAPAGLSSVDVVESAASDALALAAFPVVDLHTRYAGKFVGPVDRTIRRVMPRDVRASSLIWIVVANKRQ